MQRRQGAPRVAAEALRGATSKLRKLPITCPAGGVNATAVSVPVTLTAASAGCIRKVDDTPARSLITAQPHDQSAVPIPHD
jgi:hypothetical protein